jgi:REP element-mobilizing transposase RayT
MFVQRISVWNFVQKTMGYFHVYTKGLEDALVFRDREDFVAGMNLVAVVCFSVNVRLLAFVLMSNHVHFVVKGARLCPGI